MFMMFKENSPDGPAPPPGSAGKAGEAASGSIPADVQHLIPGAAGRVLLSGGDKVSAGGAADSIPSEEPCSASVAGVSAGPDSVAGAVAAAGSGTRSGPVECLAALSEVMADLLSSPSWQWSNEDVGEVLEGVRALASQLVAARSQVLVEAGARGFAASTGSDDLPAWMCGRLQMTRDDAQREIALARDTVEGPYRAVGQALADGRLGPENARAIVEALRRLPKDLSQEAVAKAEALMLEAAQFMDRRELQKYGVEIRERLTYVDDSPGGDDPEADALTGEHEGRGKPGTKKSGDGGGDAGGAPVDPHAARRLTFADTASGTTLISGELDAEGAGLLRTALDGLSAPAPSADGIRDERSPARRRADALVELAHRALSADTVPSSGGTRPHLTVTVGWETLVEHGCEPAVTNWRIPLPRDVLRRIVCDAVVSRIVLDPNGVPLDVGRARRTFPPHIRRALIKRDQGCAFPGCDRPPSWTDAHHVVSWLDGGESALDNGVLLCGHHHSRVHHEHWDIVMDVDRRPTFVPPEHIDPQRRPRRNPYSQPRPDLFSTA